jgi:chromosome segregation ATPase
VLDFEGILRYFRVNLPKKYRNVEAANILVGNALRIKVKRLKKYQREYNAIKEQERNYVDPVTRLTNDNKKLMEDIMRYEYTVTNLVLSKATAEETCSVLEEELSRTKMSLKELEDFNARLKEETNSVKLV